MKSPLKHLPAVIAAAFILSGCGSDEPTAPLDESTASLSASCTQDLKYNDKGHAVYTCTVSFLDANNLADVGFADESITVSSDHALLHIDEEGTTDILTDDKGVASLKAHMVTPATKATITFTPGRHTGIEEIEIEINIAEYPQFSMMTEQTDRQTYGAQWSDDNEGGSYKVLPTQQVAVGDLKHMMTAPIACGYVHAYRKTVQAASDWCAPSHSSGSERLRLVHSDAEKFCIALGEVDNKALGMAWELATEAQVNSYAEHYLGDLDIAVTEYGNIMEDYNGRPFYSIWTRVFFFDGDNISNAVDIRETDNGYTVINSDDSPDENATNGPERRLVQCVAIID